MMKELCIDVRLAFNSGIGTYIRNLIAGLKNGPFKLRLIAHPETLPKWPLLSQFDLILSSSPLYSIEEQIKLPFLIPRSDLFWSPHYNIPLLPIRAKKRMVTIHDVYHLAFKHKLSAAKKIYASCVISQAAKRSDLIITVSEFSKLELIKYVGPSPEKIKVIHLGVDQTHFSIKKESLPEKYLLYVGNLLPHKNVQGLLNALKYLKDPNLKLVIVSKTTGAPSERVIYLNDVENKDLPSLYQNAYALVHPSFYEGFGFTPLEAMSCGCPVIASKAASLPEVCGDAAIYIDPYSPESIARGIEEVAAVREVLKTKGFERVKKFNWDKTVKEHIEAIEKIL